MPSVIVPRGSDAHERLCDAVLLHGGYVLDDKGLTLYEVMGAVWAADLDAFAWTIRLATYAGSA